MSKNLDGWKDVRERKPTHYDLVLMLFDNGKIQPGWWTGQMWDAGKGMKGVDVIAWKKMTYHPR